MIEPPHPSDRPAPASGPDDLDPQELVAAVALRKADVSALDQLSQDLANRATAHPPAEPEAGRRSFGELLTLLRAGRDKTGGAATLGARGGYVVEGAPERGTAQVRPAFAESLAAATPGNALRSAFADIWAIDLDVWRALEQPCEEIAALWLSSPGRRLLQELRILRAMPGSPRGATELSTERIHRAAGVWGAPLVSDQAKFAAWAAAQPASWRTFHLCIPGLAATHWSTSDVAGALHALDLAEEGVPASIRGAALGWLLRRANENPHYETRGISRDLRDELAARLQDAVTLDGASAARAPAQLEELTLSHASQIQAGDTEPGNVFRCWAVAHWLAACLWRSPFFGGDEPTLVARLRALPAEPVAPRDALDPALFSQDGLSVSEVAFVGGALAHTARKGGVAVVPPSPLVGEMRLIAERNTLRPGEERAEDLLFEGKNELGWIAPHVAPPLVARLWLTERQIPWLARASSETQMHMLHLLSTHPKRFGWCCFAFMEEGPGLTLQTKESACEAWKSLWLNEELDAYERCAFGVGILEGLDDSGANDVLNLAVAAEGTWSPFLLDILAKRADSFGRDELWRKAVHLLLNLAENRGASETLRLNGALFAAWRLSSKSNIQAELARLGDLSRVPPFSRHPGLQRELRRRGLGPARASGGER